MTEELGAAWYTLGLKDDEFRAKAQAAEKTLGAIGTKVNSLSGMGPDKLTAALGRAVREADEARAAVDKLARADNLDPGKARKYADALEEIDIEAQQLGSELRELQAADPRFNTAELQHAATELDRVGNEAGQSADQLNKMKGVRADTHLERVAQEANEAAGNLDRAGRSSDGLRGQLLSVKNLLAGAGIFIGLQQAVQLLGDASEAFRETEQTGRTVIAVYGASAAAIEDWAERAATAAGMSKREVQESAAVMGSSLMNMGFDAARSADVTVRAQQRAADLAISYGRDTGEAILGLNALLRGEFDTIEKFGVRIKETDVQARILALGLDTTTLAAERQAEAIATLDLFFEQTAASAGRFGDSQGDLAVKLEQNQAKIDNGMATLGEWVAAVQLEVVETAERSALGIETIANAWQLAFGDEAARDAAGHFFTRMTEDQWDAVEESGNAWAAYQTQLSDALYGDGGAVPTVASSALEMARLIGGMPEAGADELLANQFHLGSAIDQLIAFMDAALSPAQEVWNARAFLASQEYRDGMASGIPAVVAKTEDLRDQAIAVLENASAFTGGQSLADSWVQGMVNSWSGRTPTGGVHRVEGIVGHAAAIFGQSLPTEGPLKGGVASGGFSVGESWVDGVLDALELGRGLIAGGVEAAADALRGKAPPGGIRPDVVLDTTYIRDLRGIQTIKGYPNPPGFMEGWAPYSEWEAQQAAPGNAGQTGGGLTQNVNVNVQGLVRAETPEDIGIQARRGAQLGVAALRR